MTIDEVKDMLPQKPERMLPVEEPKKSELVKACYELVGCLHEVYKQLGPGLPEYIYQEALAKILKAKGIVYRKEVQFHPLFMGEPLEAYLKMDLVVESPIGNIIVECKALTELGEASTTKPSVTCALRNGPSPSWLISALIGARR